MLVNIIYQLAYAFYRKNKIEENQIIEIMQQNEKLVNDKKEITPKENFEMNGSQYPVWGQFHENVG